MFHSFRNILVQNMVIFWPKTDGHIDRDINVIDVKEFCNNILPTALSPYYVTLLRISTKSERVDVD